jgi:dihydroxy-acid dehydratase
MLKNHRSRMVTEGVTRTPHRAFLRATGLDDEDMAKSMVAIIGTAGDNTPCSKSLGPQADSARLGVAEGGGVPVVMNTISVSDGTSMNHDGMRMSLVSRELIADSMEATVRGHQWDGIFGFGGCDKNMPGLLMGMVRCNVPAVFVYGGARCPGKRRARREHRRRLRNDRPGHQRAAPASRSSSR